MPGPLPRIHGRPGGIGSQAPLDKVVNQIRLPPALQLLIPVLAADQGRGRARPLLFIAGVAPALIDQNIAELDAPLGSSSPGPAGLADLAS